MRHSKCKTPPALFEEPGTIAVFKKKKGPPCPICKSPSCPLFRQLSSLRYAKQERMLNLDLYHRDPCPKCNKYRRWSKITRECRRCKEFRVHVEKLTRVFLDKRTNEDTRRAEATIFAYKWHIPLMKVVDKAMNGKLSELIPGEDE